MSNTSLIKIVAKLLVKSKGAVFFTGAGISVESGIAPFRGKGGVWNKYDPNALELAYYKNNPAKSWKVIKKLFYESISEAKPNDGHLAIAELENMKMVSAVITQNIDNLHQKAGSSNIIELHGNLNWFICQKCGNRYSTAEIDIDAAYPRCLECKGLLKPDFIFFSEGLSQDVLDRACNYSAGSDLYIIIGSSGEVQPANQFPSMARNNNATIVEINTHETVYTRYITDIFIKGSAGSILNEIVEVSKELTKK